MPGGATAPAGEDRSTVVARSSVPVGALVRCSHKEIAYTQEWHAFTVPTAPAGGAREARLSC